MQPVSPVIKSRTCYEYVVARDQPQYRQLPVAELVKDGIFGEIATKWKLTWRERFAVFFGGHIWLKILRFNRPLQPVMICTSEQEVLASIHQEVVHES